MSEKQLLIESSDFSLTCNLSEKEKASLTESLKISAGKHGNLIVKNIPCTILDRRNQNGRVYPTKLMQQALNEAMPKMQAKMLVCSASEHPSGSFVEPANISHCVINAYIKNVEVEVEGKRERHNVLFNDWEVLNEKSQVAAHVQQLILSGFGIGTSIRSLGSCDPDGTVTELEYLGTDIVGQPSSSTYVNMPINESVKISTTPLTETYIVSASATNVVRDLDSALALSQQIDNAQFGTVKKTSTKLDSEVDPKTGAETTMVTLETETEDEVSELDQALMMAKRAMMNGKADIDSVTIENVKEEQPKESVKDNSEDTLKEDDSNLGLKTIVDMKGVSITGPDEEELWKLAGELRNFKDHNAVEWQRSYKSLTDAGVDQTYLDYANGKDMTVENNDGLQEDEGHYVPQPHITPILNYILRNFPKDSEAYEVAVKMANDIVAGRISSAEDREKALEELKKYVTLQYKDYIPESEMNDSMGTISGEYKANHIGSPEKVAENMVQRQYNFIVGNTQEADPMRQQAENIFAKFEQGQVNAIDTKVALGEIAYELQKKLWGESKLTEAKEEEQEDPNKGKQYVLKCKTNDKYVAMNGNAIDFVNDPKDAIHFVEGEEESGVVHLSGIEKILKAMGILETEKYFKQDTIDISAPDDVNVQAAEKDGVKVEECGNKAPITEDNGSNTRFQAIVKITDANGESSEKIPVSAVDMEGINAEVDNLYDMKKQKGKPDITVVDTSSGQQFMFNPKTHQIEAMNMQMEAAGDLEQDGNKLSMEVDDNNKVEKEFDTPAQASIAKAGIEQGKFGGDVLLSEDDTSLDDDDEESETAKCEWCGEEFEKSALKKEKDLGYLCNTCARGIASREGPLTFEEAEDELPVRNDLQYDNIEPGWYASGMGVGIIGPYKTKEELRNILGTKICKIADSGKGLVNINYVEPDEVKDINVTMDEVLYNQPSNASDPLIQQPLKDATEDEVVFEIENIDWDNNSLYQNFLTNYEPSDPTAFGDLNSKVMELPEKTAIRVNYNELPEDVHEFKNYILHKLGEIYAMNVNDADITSVHYVN